jgi:MraZ protein
MLRGPDNLTVDAKGRMPLPSRHRELIQELCQGQLFVTLDRDRCLLIYPKPVWLEVEAKITSLPDTNAYAKKLKRLMVGNATEVELDSANRILIKPLLRQYAGIEKKVVLMGQGSKFELWDEARYLQSLDDWGTRDQAEDEAQMTEDIAKLTW